MKDIRDTFDIQIIFSGSSALWIDKETTDLSRRAPLYELPVLSLREFIEIETESAFQSFSLEEYGYVAADDIETGSPGQIPLWAFGMMYETGMPVAFSFEKQ